MTKLSPLVRIAKNDFIDDLRASSQEMYMIDYDKNEVWTWL